MELDLFMKENCKPPSFIDKITEELREYQLAKAIAH